MQSPNWRQQDRFARPAEKNAVPPHSSPRGTRLPPDFGRFDHSGLIPSTNREMPACNNRDNLAIAERCNCGYVFHGPQTDSLACLASIERSLRAIKGMLIFWLALTVIGGLLALVSVLGRLS